MCIYTSHINENIHATKHHIVFSLDFVYISDFIGFTATVKQPMLFCMHRNRRLSIRMRIDNLLLVFKGLYDIIIICEIKRFRNENNI